MAIGTSSLDDQTTFRMDLDRYRQIYRHLHANPELSNCEKETANLVATELKKSGGANIIVKERIGGYGVAAFDANGPGKTVLIRADMDALPVEEMTSLPYASRKRMRDAKGIEQPVMHACGHDMHVACLLAASEWLSMNRNRWSGTIVYLFQPAEERGTGAQAMVDDGLYTKHKVPKPDSVVSGHVVPARAGVVATNRGSFARSARNYRVTMYGRGGHASRPDATINPVDLASEAIAKVKDIHAGLHGSLCSVVCTSVHAGGGAENIVADSATMTFDIRAGTDGEECELLARFKGAISDATQGALMPSDVVETRRFPVTFNDEGLYLKMDKAFASHFGRGPHSYVEDYPLIAFSEDFSVLATSITSPSIMFVWGVIEKDQYDRAKNANRILDDIPTNHSAYFAPSIDPALSIGFEAYCLSALSLLDCLTLQ